MTTAARALPLGRAPRVRQETAAPGRAIVARMRTSPDAEAERSPTPRSSRATPTGDQAAARVLTARHAPRVFALARRMLGEVAEAEDVTQETMLRLWKIAPDWQADRAALGTWLYRVASNLCIDRLRRRPRASAATPCPRSPTRPRARSAACRRATGPRRSRRRWRPCPTASASPSCSATSRTAPNPEIAAILDTSVEAVESLLARARRELAARLAPRKAELGFTDG